jgi:hypothetical protein
MGSDVALYFEGRHGLLTSGGGQYSVILGGSGIVWKLPRILTFPELLLRRGSGRRTTGRLIVRITLVTAHLTGVGLISIHLGLHLSDAD